MNHIQSLLNKGILNLKHQNEFFLSHPRKRLIFIISFIGIILWQLIYVFRPCINEEYRRKETSGFVHDYAQKFFYFYYYLDLFPITAGETPLTYSREGAMQVIREHGDSLQMEYKHWSRLGENARILMYLPKAWFTQSAEKPDIMPTNAILFILSLLVIYSVFWKYHYPLVGFFLVSFLGSDPFLLYETYERGNIFAFLAINTLFILAINFRFLKPAFSKKYMWLMPIVSGIIIGTAVHIRGENIMVLGCCLMIYLTIVKYKWSHKILLCFICLFSFIGTTGFWKNYFDRKFKEAHIIVEAAGGNPYNGHRGNAHTLWHPIFCGLGDYDKKYGYHWTDQSAYRYALPIMKRKYNLDLAYSGGYGLDEYYDQQKKYYLKIELLKEYDEVVKNKVLTDIKNEPAWYASIISKRIFSVFKDTSPIWVKAGKIEIHFPVNGLFTIPFLILLVYYKRWFELRLITFSFPLAATSVLIYSKGNSTYNSIFHLFFMAFLFSWIAEIIFTYLKNRNKKPQYV